MKNNTTISCHQTGVLAGILFLTLKLSSFPSILYRYSTNNSIWIFLVYILINFGLVGLIIWFKFKHPNQSLYSILKNTFSAVVTKIIYIALFAFFMFKLLSLCSDGFTFIKETCHKDLSLIKFLVCFLPVIIAMAYSGIRNVARTCEFFYPIVVIFMTLIIIFSAIPISALSSKIVIDFQASTFFNTLFDLSFWMGDAFVLLVIVDKIEIQKGKLRQLFVPLIIMSLFLFFIYIIYFALYTRTSDFYTNAILDVLQYAVSTTDGWHMDILSILVFMLTILMQGAVILYSAKETITKVIHFNNSKIVYFGIICLLVVVEFLYLNDYLAYVDFAKNVLHYFAFSLLVIVPLLVGFVVIKKQKKEKKSE